MGERINIELVFGTHLQRPQWITQQQQQQKKTKKNKPQRTMLIFHSSFNVVRIYVMHVYCLTEINTLNLTTIYKVFAYVIFHDKIYSLTHTHIFDGRFFSLAFVRSIPFLFILHVGFY